MTRPTPRSVDQPRRSRPATPYRVRVSMCAAGTDGPEHALYSMTTFPGKRARAERPRRGRERPSPGWVPILRRHCSRPSLHAGGVRSFGGPHVGDAWLQMARRDNSCVRRFCGPTTGSRVVVRRCRAHDRAKRSVTCAEAREITQVELARRLAVSQATVSKFEKSNPTVSTVKRYVEALGGRLEMAAVFDDGRMLLEY